MINPPKTDFKKDSHCSYCGTKFTEQKSWPRKCFICYNESYKNPTPVVVTVIPVCGRKPNDVGYLIIKRGINPKKGGWAFPGGYIDTGETWQHAAVRELEEEMGLKTKEEDYRLLSIHHSKEDDNMLIFCAHKGIRHEDIDFVPNHEVEDYKLIYSPGQLELCFPLHQLVMEDYFHNLGND